MLVSDNLERKKTNIGVANVIIIKKLCRNNSRGILSGYYDPSEFYDPGQNFTFLICSRFIRRDFGTRAKQIMVAVSDKPIRGARKYTVFRHVNRCRRGHSPFRRNRVFAITNRARTFMFREFPRNTELGTKIWLKITPA